MEAARAGVESGAHFVPVQVFSPVLLPLLLQRQKASAPAVGAADGAGAGDALREWYVPPSLSHRIAEKMSQSARDATAHHEHYLPNTGLSIHIDPGENADTEHAIVKLTTKEKSGDTSSSPSVISHNLF
jgi:hypothetical protein